MGAFNSWVNIWLSFLRAKSWWTLPSRRTSLSFNLVKVDVSSATKCDFPSFLVGFVVYIGLHFVITYKSPSHNYATPSAISNETLSETCRQARVLACLAAANVSPSLYHSAKAGCLTMDEEMLRDLGIVIHSSGGEVCKSHLLANIVVFFREQFKWRRGMQRLPLANIIVFIR